MSTIYAVFLAGAGGDNIAWTEEDEMAMPWGGTTTEERTGSDAPSPVVARAQSNRMVLRRGEIWTDILRSTLPSKPMLKGGEKYKFKVKVIAENMGPVGAKPEIRE